ncbi:MAG: DNA primase large subunit PriL [Candidatus Methylarchaceae archaeon HK01M]|nr:DNA primase large subunit PriL [Candidatus Methylarchaceae archaeon HK01M]
MGIEFGLEDLAKYPFMKEAGDYVKKLSLRVEDLGQEDYRPAVERAKQRVMEAIQKNYISIEISEPIVELLSFPLALMLVKAMNVEYIIHRYSLAEAIRAESLLKEEKKSIISYIFKSTFNLEPISVKHELFDLKIKLIEYLKRATHFHEPEWKLINRVVDNGFVYLKTHELVRLIREEIRRTIYDRMKGVSLPSMPKNLKEAVHEISRVLPPRSDKFQRVTPDKFPPCIIYTLDLIKKGQNLSHYGRFLLTTYLLSIGKSVDDIIDIYPRSPDFNERMTRYQVEHIAGMRGGRRRYKVPSCRTLATHGLCFKDKILCAKIRSPFQFGKKPLFKKKSTGQIRE